MSKVEFYEMQDEVIAKENNKEKKNIKETKKEFKGSGEGFVCSLECRTCGNE